MCAPVIRGVAHRYVDGLVLFSGSAKRFSSPWIPINGVFGVLPKIREVSRDSRFGMCLPDCSVTLANRAHNKSPGTLGSRRSDDFTPRLHGRCPEGSVRSC
jgi:hypothetical protein